MENLLLIIFILVVAWYWWDTQQCNETALVVCQQKCMNAGFQLLDATVTRQRTWLRRIPGGIQICRLYSFEYAGAEESGQDITVFPNKEFGERQQGYIVLLGKQVVETKLPQQDVDN